MVWLTCLECDGTGFVSDNSQDDALVQLLSETVQTIDQDAH